ncbi:MAG TPA: acetolactate decarboxylase [Candidatus Polarisedimenticolaceae bacterium]|nr:acetolactate decarboxylase [Candidatus Polarisedimenticolaceae bacterium]
MRHRMLLIFPLLLTACAGVQRSSGDPWDGQVRVDGALRAMMHEGKTGPAVKLSRLLPDDALYAVGALADMAGEVTIVGGRTYLSYGKDRKAEAEMTRDSDAAASLLVSARVPAWRLMKTDGAIQFKDLDEKIAALASKAGMDTQGRIPFVVEGRVRELEWHVHAGSSPEDGPKSHEDHLKDAAAFRLPNTLATLVGFYSPGDEGVFTHMGSKTHVHVVAGTPPGAGHVDHVMILPGAIVRFPLKVAALPAP